MTRLALMVLALGAALGSDVCAQEARTDYFDIKPVLLGAADGGGDGSLALEYDLKGVLLNRPLYRGASTGEIFEEPSLPYGFFKVSYDGRGTLASSADDNPLNFLDLGVRANGLYTGGFGTLMGGVFGRFESDQSFDATQVVIGVMATYSKMGVLTENASLTFDLGYGRVAPGEDVERKTALGVTTLDDFDRMQFEALYIYPTGLPVVETVELNYRLYAEVDAPAAVSAAGLDTHELWTVRLGLPMNLFVAYSSGKLPFDRQDDEIFEIGLSYSLK